MSGIDNKYCAISKFSFASAIFNGLSFNNKNEIVLKISL